MYAWQIDALDPRGGIAFASWRSFSLVEEVDHLKDAPCVLIAAPFFRPEPVATRALARASARGPFQLGLFVNGEEVRFAALDAVAEFVRRAYLRSGGGDGLDGGAAPIPPTPTGGAPDLPPLPGSPEELLGGGEEVGPRPGRGSGGEARPVGPDVLEFLAKFESKAGSSFTNPASADHFSWTAGPSGDGGVAKTDAGTRLLAPTIGTLRRPEDALGWAALLLIQEMLSRLPVTAEPSQQLGWERAARSLAHTVARLGLCDWLRMRQGSHTLQSWTDSVRKSADWLDWDYAPWAFFDYPFLFDEKDAFEELRLIPVPKSLASIISSAASKDASLVQLLTAATASPSELKRDGQGGRDATALLLFSACAVVVGDGEAREPYWLSRRGPRPSRLQEQWFDELVAHGWSWLAGSLPRLVFPFQLEAAVASASRLRYRGDSTGTTPSSPPLTRTPTSSEAEEKAVRP